MNTNAYYHNIPIVPTIAEIVQESASEVLQIPRENLYDKTRKQEYVFARYLVYHFFATRIGIAPAEIVRTLRSTNIKRCALHHAINEAIPALLKFDKEFKNLQADFQSKIRAKTYDYERSIAVQTEQVQN